MLSTLTTSLNWRRLAQISSGWIPRRLAVFAAVASIASVSAPVYAGAVGIQGTMSNFDVFNETGVNVYGAELDLEGVHPADVTKTFPSHFNNMSMTEYASGGTFGTRIVFSGYNFLPSGFIAPTVGINTNGHYAVNVPGAEHFGFANRVQPTATRYYWLDQSNNHVSPAPLSIPNATWTYVAPVGANPPIIQAVLAPPPPPPLVQFPDAVWVKTFVTELSRQVDLNELISAPPADQVAPQLPSQVEAEWELLPGDSPLPEPDVQLAEADQSILRRYEFFKYTGGYDEVHLPTSAFTGGTPDPAEIGQFIAANMVAVNLAVEVPETSTLALVWFGAIIGCAVLRRNRMRPVRASR